MSNIKHVKLKLLSQHIKGRKLIVKRIPLFLAIFIDLIFSPYLKGSQSLIDIEIPIKISQTNPGMFPQLQGQRLRPLMGDPGPSQNANMGIFSLALEKNLPLKKAIEKALNAEKHRWLEGVFKKHDISQKMVETITIAVDRVTIYDNKKDPRYIDTNEYPEQFQKTPAQLKAEDWIFLQLSFYADIQAQCIEVTLVPQRPDSEAPLQKPTPGLGTPDEKDTSSRRRKSTKTKK